MKHCLIEWLANTQKSEVFPSIDEKPFCAQYPMTANGSNWLYGMHQKMVLMLSYEKDFV